MIIRRLAPALLVALAACPRHHAAAPAPDNQPGDPLQVEAPPAEVPPPTIELKGGAITSSEAIEYEAGSDKIAASSEDVLVGIRDLLNQRTDVSLVRIESHSDAQGNDQYNQQLTEHRALAVARWLAGNGVDCQRLIPVGFGETKPVADNASAAGRAQNRRTEFVVASLRGHLIGGMPADGGGVVAGDPCTQP